ncbi:hypothetical protein CYMTET_7901 [Cymbomonas tetramitiformis]|uniref:Uncharacterized protein n=1 Tax=Cymbomonas tetramitiformis TaxID=36881 RepID=A0AAE0GUL7_9CHLO|nr:hypothetical protein CYMTET_7901 [Cymbomonas tetramitiformis]|eukprot:gene28125-34807_t
MATVVDLKIPTDLKNTFLLSWLQRTRVVIELTTSFSVAQAAVPAIHSYFENKDWNDTSTIFRVLSVLILLYTFYCFLVWGLEVLERKLKNGDRIFSSEPRTKVAMSCAKARGARESPLTLRGDVREKRPAPDDPRRRSMRGVVRVLLSSRTVRRYVCYDDDDHAALAADDCYRYDTENSDSADRYVAFIVITTFVFIGVVACVLCASPTVLIRRRIGLPVRRVPTDDAEVDSIVNAEAENT